jgi:tetratricopeptide (TPR) repeat protein
LYWLLEGLRLAAIYCERQEIPFDGEEKILSFELLPDSKIKCYGWTDTPEEGTPEAEEEAATIAYLQTDFNSFFIAPYLETNMSAAELGKALLQEKDYAGALAQLQLACREEPQAQKELFLLMYEAHFALDQLREAADVLMKAYLLGLHKSQIRRQIAHISQVMLGKPEILADANERERWQRLYEDFC